MLTGTLGAANNVVGPTKAATTTYVAGGTENPIGQSEVVSYSVGAGLSGTVDVEMTLDGGTTWEKVTGHSNFTTFPVQGRIQRIHMQQQFRLKCSAYTSGSAVGRVENLPPE